MLIDTPRVLLRDRWARRLQVFALMAGLALLGQGCVRMDVMPKPDPQATAPLSRPMPADQADVQLVKDPTKIYRIGPKDVLQIDVRKDPSLTRPYTVTAEGNVLLPNIGPVRVAELTTQEVEAELNRLLEQFIREPDVKVGIQDYQSKVVYVVGQVANPGPQVMRADMLTLQEAIFGAGLPLGDAAPKRTRVITPDDENPVVRQIDLTDILYRGRMGENVLLRPNDIVYVPSRYSTNVSAAIRELLVPFNDINDFRYRSNVGGGEDGGLF